MIGHLQHVAGDVAFLKQLALARVLRIAGEEELRIAIAHAHGEGKIVLLVAAVAVLVRGGDPHGHASRQLKGHLGADLHGRLLRIFLFAERLDKLRMLLAFLVVYRHDDPADIDLLEHLVRSADVILVVVGDDHRIDPVDPLARKALDQLLAALVRAGIDEDVLAAGRGDEHGVRLAHVVEIHAQLLRAGKGSSEQERRAGEDHREFFHAGSSRLRISFFEKAPS